jgi:hypothetical protein
MVGSQDQVAAATILPISLEASPAQSLVAPILAVHFQNSIASQRRGLSPTGHASLSQLSSKENR